MSIKFTSNFGDIANQIVAEASEAMHEAMAEELAAKAREHGLSNAATIKLQVSAGSEGYIDAERVRARANQILAEG